MAPNPNGISRRKITIAGSTLINSAATSQAKLDALALINIWRACHAYPLNTFNVTLRKRVKKITSKSLVAQRLKRVPSIEKKLLLNHKMKLARMQDIGGLRAVVENISQVRKLEAMYKTTRSKHVLSDIDDYINNPKDSGYRSLHLIYKYNNPKAEAYKGFNLEIQIRTKLQHAWATAVETIGSFLNQALKSSEGSDEWLTYFKYVSAAFAIDENSPILNELSALSKDEIFKTCLFLENKLGVKEKLQAFSIAAKAINTNQVKGTYHLIILDTELQNVQVYSYPKKELEEASKAYAKAEKSALENSSRQVVLVATDSAESLKRAYPNYFLDTRAFVRHLNRILKPYTLKQEMIKAFNIPQ